MRDHGGQMRGALLLMETAEGGGKRVFITGRGDEDIACVADVACGILRQSQTQRLAQEPMRAAIGVRRGEGGFLRAGAAGNPVEMLADEAQDVGGFAARRMREINFAVCFDGQAQTAVVAPWRTAMDAPGLSGVRDIENGRAHAEAVRLIPPHPLFYRFRQLLQQRFRVFPADAGVGDALPVDERFAGFEFLRAFDQMAFDHHAEDVLLASGDLRGDVSGGIELAFVLFVAVGVAAINHDFVLHAGAAQRGDRFTHVGGAVVRTVVAAAQDEVAVFVAVGGDDGGMPQFGDGEEAVNRLRRGDGVDGDLHVAVGAVFEADRAGEAGGELAVHLAFGGARADRAPADEVCDVLRDDHVEVFDGDRHAFVGGVEQQFAPDAQAVVDGKRAVQMRVVEQAFPADGGARFFKVNAHDDAQLFAVFFAQGQEAVGIFARGFDVVDGAGADDDEQSRVVVVQDGVDVAPRLVHGFGGAFAHRIAFQQGDGRQEFLDAGNPQVIGLVHGGHP